MARKLSKVERETLSMARASSIHVPAEWFDGDVWELDSLDYAFLRGESPEGIADSWPALTLEQIFGALSFYLANRESVDQYLSAGKEEFERLRAQARAAHPALYAKMAEARRTAQSALKSPAA